MAASLSALLIDKHSFYDHLRVQYLHDLTHVENDAPSHNESSAIKAEPSSQEKVR
jgi:hypothetical protein